MKSNQLIPEFAIQDINRSIAFYSDILGFEIQYERPEEGFAFLTLGDAQIMLDQIDLGRTFGGDLREKPLGLGLNVQIFVDEIQQSKMLNALENIGHPLYLDLEEKWYRADQTEVGHKQFVVADPDGYLLRFVVSIGMREI